MIKKEKGNCFELAVRSPRGLKIIFETFSRTILKATCMIVFSACADFRAKKNLTPPKKKKKKVNPWKCIKNKY